MILSGAERSKETKRGDLPIRETELFNSVGAKITRTEITPFRLTETRTLTTDLTDFAISSPTKLTETT